MSDTITTMTIARLVAIEVRLAQRIASVHGVVTRDEIEERDALRVAVGASYDPLTGHWMPLEEA